MKPLLLGCIALLLCSSVLAQENYRGGIVYGPKAAFNISAPEGWVLDNQSGANQGLPCVLYPKASAWSDARTIMYAKIASTQYEDVDKFVAIAIKEMKDRHGLPKQKIESGKTGDGKPYFINEYPATFTMGARRVYPIASRGCLRRLIVKERIELSQRLSGTPRDLEKLRVSRAQIRSGTALTSAIGGPLY